MIYNVLAYVLLQKKEDENLQTDFNSFKEHYIHHDTLPDS